MQAEIEGSIIENDSHNFVRLVIFFDVLLTRLPELVDVRHLLDEPLVLRQNFVVLPHQCLLLFG